MSKIHPSSSSSSSSSSRYKTTNKETFTIWMKSLIFNGYGCTVYDSQGQIIYRMDNYGDRHSKQVHLMDLKGNLLFTIRRKKLSISRCWEAYKCNPSGLEDGKPCFRVKKAYPILKRRASCEATMHQGYDQSSCVYRIQALSRKVACKIVNDRGELVAEVMQKQSMSGNTLGEDVMKLVVEPNEDHSLVMALVVVHSLMNRRM